MKVIKFIPTKEISEEAKVKLDKLKLNDRERIKKLVEKFKDEFKIK